PRFLVAEVVHRAPARQAGGGCPQWIVGGGDEHLITVVEQRLQRHLDQFTDPVAEPYVVDRGAADAALPVVLHDGGPRRQQALRIRVAVRRREIANDIDKDVLRRVEAERGRIADVQLDDAPAFLLETLRLLEHRAADVVKDVLELARLGQIHCTTIAQAGWISAWATLVEGISCARIDWSPADAGRRSDSGVRRGGAPPSNGARLRSVPTGST